MENLYATIHQYREEVLKSLENASGDIEQTLVTAEQTLRKQVQELCLQQGVSMDSIPENMLRFESDLASRFNKPVIIH
jgi:F0F1-type ATP synthase membrane subunit b/b'